MIVGGWRPAQVIETSAVTPSARVLRLSVPGWPGSEPGQHVDIRLTAADGYQAVRSYSLGSYGPDTTIELAVDEVPDGEVSPYLVQEVRAGDELEVKGPLGGYFVWRPGGAAPVQLIAGGSGIVPLAAMVRARADAASGPSFRLLYSVRTPQDAIYRDLLAERARSGGVELTWVYTRGGPDGWIGRVGRIDDAVIGDAVWPADAAPEVFVCGPTSFVEHVADALVRLGHPPASIKTERFGGAR
ncbi:ferredoxin reductase [Microbacterium sp. BWT-B31]|uniref:ferredoxin reductase n=1 Tax=Microbacterium sp. BWT-B31 TaxID=3232072 RepID=UPI003526F125